MLGENLFGAYDAKLTTRKLSQSLHMVAVSGPTSINERPFDWTKVQSREKKAPHIDQPTVWNFKPVLTDWRKVKTEDSNGFDNFNFNF